MNMVSINRSFITFEMTAEQHSQVLALPKKKFLNSLALGVNLKLFSPFCRAKRPKRILWNKGTIYIAGA